MVGKNNKHGHGSQHTTAAWMDKNLGGFIIALGKGVETIFDKTMFLIVNGFFLRAGKAALVLIVPVIVVELFVHTLHF